SLATYDFGLLKRAASNFGFAVVSGLITSTLYFLVTPISEAHSELLARTQPNIYDVLIALFGGLAGIVAMSSKMKGNVIPGVAIATALMPPLCTAGYGLATANWTFFLGAFYLFTINSVFIAASTLVAVRLLKFPIGNYANEKQKITANRWVTAIAVMTVVPSIYFGYIMVKQERYNQNAASFIRNESYIEGDYLLQSNINAATKTISLVYGGKIITEDEKENLRSKLPFYGLAETELTIQQGFKIDDVDFQNSVLDQSKSELNRIKAELVQNQFALDSMYKQKEVGKVLLNEIQSLFPQVIACSAGEQIYFRDTVATPYYLVVVKTESKPLTVTDRSRLTAWLSSRLEADSVLLFMDN